MGAWIEIFAHVSPFPPRFVAPFVGAWIEIAWSSALDVSPKSLPSWERVLKFGAGDGELSQIIVALFVGVWLAMRTTRGVTFAE